KLAADISRSPAQELFGFGSNPSDNFAGRFNGMNQAAGAAGSHRAHPGRARSDCGGKFGVELIAASDELPLLTVPHLGELVANHATGDPVRKWHIPGEVVR